MWEGKPKLEPLDDKAALEQVRKFQAYAADGDLHVTSALSTPEEQERLAEARAWTARLDAFWPLILYLAGHQYLFTGCVRPAQSARALRLRRAKNKVAAASRRQNRSQR